MSTCLCFRGGEGVGAFSFGKCWLLRGILVISFLNRLILLGVFLSFSAFMPYFTIIASVFCVILAHFYFPRVTSFLEKLH